MALFKLNDNNLVVSLDFGSYGLRCAVFKKSSESPFELLAFTEKKSTGLENSRITDFEDLSLALSEVLESAEEMCKSSFSEVYLGFSPPFYSFRSQGMVALTDREVKQSDLDLAVLTACAVPLPNQHICLHKSPECFSVDNQAEVLNPLGLSGLRLETEVCLVTVPQFYCRDIMKMLKLLGYSPKAFFHNLTAFSRNLTTFRQKKSGVCFCDIGDKSTRLIVYADGKTQKMLSLPLGGKDLSQGLASKFNISIEEAELLKEQHGQLFCNFSNEESLPAHNLYISRKLFIETLQKLSEELLNKIKQQLSEAQLMDKLSSGFIFTGGTSELPGFKDLASLCLGKPVCFPEKIYPEFKQVNNFALVQQIYSDNKRQVFKQKRSVWRELF